MSDLTPTVMELVRRVSILEDAVGRESTFEVPVSANVPHTILDGSVHTDSAAYPVVEGALAIGNATPAWDGLPPPAAAGYALVSGPATFAWDQTPAWTGTHSFADGITFNGISDANEITIPDNTAVAFEIEDAGGIEYLRIISTDAGPIVNFNSSAVNIDFRVEAVGHADAFRVLGTNGQITLGALGAGVVQSDVGGVLSSGAVPLIDLGGYAEGSLIIGGAVDWETLVEPGGAGHALISDGTTFAWDQDPTWTGDHAWISSVSAHPALTIENTNADAQAPVIEFYKNSASPAASDDLGAFDFYGETDTGVKDRYAYWLAESLDVTNGATGGGMRFMVTMNGTDRFLLSLLGFSGVADQGEVIINEAGQDVDFIVEAVGAANALFVRGSDGFVGIGTNAPTDLLTVTGGNVGIDSVLQHNGDADTFTSFADDRFLISCGGVTMADFIEGVVNDVIILGGDALIVPDDFVIAVDGIAQGRLVFDSTPAPDEIRIESANLDLNDNDFILDADGDSYIHASADDVVDLVLATASGEFGITINGAEDFTFTANSFNVLAGSYINEHGVRATLGGNAAGLYVPWLAGDALGTAVFGASDVANDDITITASSGSSFGVIGSTLSGVGIQGQATSGTGVIARSTTGTGLITNLTGAGTAIADFQDNGTPVLTIQDGGQADFTEYIRHLGDTDTFLRYQTDRVSIDAGGVTFIDAVEAATDYLALHNGLNFIGDTANANMTVGLTLNQGAADDEIANFRSSDVGAVLNSVETGTFMMIKKFQGGSGGGTIRAFKDSTGSNYDALQLIGYLEENVNTNKTTAARAIIEIVGAQTDGTALEDTVANGNVMVLRTRVSGATIAVGIWDEDGDFYYRGALVAFDDENDALAAWDLSHVLSGQWNKIIKYGADKLEAMGVIGPADANGERMVSNKNMNALQLGAIGQGYLDRQDLWGEVQQLREKCQRYELALSNAGLLAA